MVETSTSLWLKQKRPDGWNKNVIMVETKTSLWLKQIRHYGWKKMSLWLKQKRYCCWNKNFTMVETKAIKAHHKRLKIMLFKLDNANMRIFSMKTNNVITNNDIDEIRLRFVDRSGICWRRRFHSKCAYVLYSLIK